MPTLTRTVTLNEQQALLSGRQLADLHLERRAADALRRATMTEFRLQLRMLDERIRLLSEQVRDRIARQEVQYEERINRATRRMESVATGNGEVLSSRPLTDAERQETLPGVPPAPSSTPTGI